MDYSCLLPEGAGDADQALRTFLLTKLILDGVVCVLILAANALTICALLHQRWCRKETLCPRFKVSSLFVMNLAVADFLIGCSVLFFLVSHYVCPISEYMSRHRILCLTKTVTFMFSGIISVTTLAAISIDRYVAVIHSLRYQEYMTRRRACGVIALTWLVGLVCAVSLLFWNHFEDGQPCLETVIPRRHFVFIGVPVHIAVLSVILVAHLRIRQEIKRMQARRKECEKSIWGAQVQSSSIKSMRAVVMVIGCYVVCYVPFMVIFGTRLMGLRSLGLEIAFQCMTSLANLNPMFNPFIYSWKNASVRNALRQFIDKVHGIALGASKVDGILKKRPSTTATTLSGSGASAASGSSALPPALASTLLTTKGTVERYVPYENVI